MINCLTFPQRGDLNDPYGGKNVSFWTARQIWKTMSRDKRAEAISALWEDKRLSGASRAGALDPWLKARGLRPQFFNELPRSRKTGLLAEGGVPEETALQILMSYHLVKQAGLLARFLDLLSIPNENGMIKEGHEVTPPSETEVNKAAGQIREEFSPEDVDLYLRTLTAADSVTWAGVAPLAGDPT